jgi:hypothetical protein
MEKMLKKEAQKNGNQDQLKEKLEVCATCNKKEIGIIRETKIADFRKSEE